MSRSTRAAILTAFQGLVVKRRYDQLRVSEIIARAGVARSTFYEHFTDKDAVLREGLSTPFSVLAEAVRPDLDAGSLEATVEHFWENRSIANLMFGGRMRPFITRLLADLILKQLAAQPGGGFILPPALVAQQTAAAQLGLLAPWLRGDASCPAAIVGEALHKTTTATLASLRRPS